MDAFITASFLSLAANRIVEAVVSPVKRLLTDKYKIEVEPVPPQFFTPENVKRADNFWLTLLGVK